MEEMQLKEVHCLRLLFKIYLYLSCLLSDRPPIQLHQIDLGSEP